MFTLRNLDELAKRTGAGLTRINTRFLEMLGQRLALIRNMRKTDRIRVLGESEREVEELIREVMRELRLNHEQALEILRYAGLKAYENGKHFYDARGLAMLPFEQNAAIQNIIMGVAAETVGKFTNLAQTSAIGVRVADAEGKVLYKTARQAYADVIDQAITDVASGQADYSSAIRHAMTQIADSGLRIVEYASGYSRRLDSSARQSILDGVKAVAEQVQAYNGKKFGADGVEIDAHNLCAPDHLPYQGRQFTQKDYDKIQASLPRPFYMWNCRHTTYPIILGYSEPLYSEEERAAMAENSNRKIEFEGKEYTRYEATQLQRRIETEIRKSKDRAVLAKAAGDDRTRRVEQMRINDLKSAYKRVTDTFNLPDSIDRAAVKGFRPVKVPKRQATGIVDVSNFSDAEKIIQIKALQDRNHVVILGESGFDFAKAYENSVTNKFVLTGERKVHILSSHPEMAGKEQELLLTIKQPFDVRRNKTDKQMAIFYLLRNDESFYRAAVWVSEKADKLNSIHSFRIAKKYEFEQGIKWRRSLIKKPD